MQDWRRDPIWQLVGVILAAIGIVDLVLGLYSDTRMIITITSIAGGVVCIFILAWGWIVHALKLMYIGAFLFAFSELSVTIYSISTVSLAKTIAYWCVAVSLFLLSCWSLISQYKHFRSKRRSKTIVGP